MSPRAFSVKSAGLWSVLYAHRWQSKADFGAPGASRAFLLAVRHRGQCRDLASGRASWDARLDRVVVVYTGRYFFPDWMIGICGPTCFD
mmetsp:Transcript_28982/g.77431  ORF Transcript_28982/g.77431 Transcript_28982/m.77431 type:complete len:89 (-) Transcript_28982:9-275(-)